jgi:hypothetical protein
MAETVVTTTRQTRIYEVFIFFAELNRYDMSTDEAVKNPTFNWWWLPGIP